jgi:hypothetical protein
LVSTRWTKKRVRRVPRDRRLKNRTLKKVKGCGTLRQLPRFIYAPPAPTYEHDVVHRCGKCDFFHLSKPEWLEPELTHQDAALLSSMGVAVPEKMPGDLRCAQCRVLFRVSIDFLILPDGRMVCETDCTPKADLTV